MRKFESVSQAKARVRGSHHGGKSRIHDRDLGWRDSGQVEQEQEGRGAAKPAAKGMFWERVEGDLEWLFSQQRMREFLSELGF